MYRSLHGFRILEASWILLCLLFVSHASSALTDPVSVAGLPENYSVRRLLREVINAPVRSAVRYANGSYFQDGSGYPVRVGSAEQNGSFYLMFVNELTSDAPIASRGTYIIKRDTGDGSFLQIKIFLRDDPGSFVRIYPDGRESIMDVYLFDRLVHSAVRLALPFEKLLTEPFARVIELSTPAVRWSYLLPVLRNGDAYRAVESTADYIRTLLPTLADADDGAIGSDGNYVYIRDLSEQLEGGLNCSGFAKWVVDGFYFPRTGTLTDIELLKEKHPDLRGNLWSDRYEAERDPYFGLDWTRNLAMTLRGLDAGDPDPERSDVRSVPYFRYIEDVGYPVANLDLIMYLLAQERPGSLYMGSVNRDFGSEPVLRQHVHIVILFPYFTSSGDFRLVVMERNVETGAASLKRRYGNDFIHLVEIPGDGEFDVPGLKIALP